MKLNGIMINHHLADTVSVKYAQCTQRYFVRRPVFYRENAQLKTRAVVVGAENFLQCVSSAQECVLICLGQETESGSMQVQDKDSQIGSNDVIYLEENVSGQEVFNALTEIFDMFDDWDGQLQRIVEGNAGFQAMLDISSAVVSRSIALMDEDFRYIAFTADAGIFHRFVDDMNRLPLEEVNSLTSMPGFRELEEIRGAFLYAAGETVVYRNIFNGEQYVGRLSILLEGEEDQETMEYDKAVFDHLGQYVERQYEKSGGFEMEPSRLVRLHQSLKQCLEAGMVDEGKLEQLLTENKSRPGDEYSVYLFGRQKFRGKTYNMGYLCVQMEKMWPGVCCVVHDGDIVMLYNATLFARSTDMDFHRELMYFLRESVLAAGISRDFKKLSKLVQAFRQACFALETGMEKNPISWYHWFEDYALDYLIRYGMGGFPPEQICSRKLLKLYDYDQENETSYYNTLKTYVRLQYNAVASAKALYIHRSSFINRMERIRELIDLNLEEADERLYLLLSFRILEEFEISGEKKAADKKRKNRETDNGE